MSTETYSELCQKLEVEYFSKIFNISGVCQGSEYASRTLKVDQDFKQFLKFNGFIGSKVVLLANK